MEPHTQVSLFVSSSGNGCQLEDSGIAVLTKPISPADSSAIAEMGFTAGLANIFAKNPSTTSVESSPPESRAPQLTTVILRV